MQHITLSPHLVLIEVPVPKPKAAASVGSEGINHIWEIDRSGSMSWLLRSLVKDLKQKVRELPAGDTITLGWFSGERERGFVLKGYKIGEKEDYVALDRAISSFESSVGMTCFSEILDETETVIKELSVFGSKYALCFFTDGYPTVGNYGREVERINMAIDKIKGSLTAGLVVGYGDYYNKELLTKMSERLGASLVHSSDLPAFSVAFKTFTEDAREASGTSVEVSYQGAIGVQALFSLNGKQINVLPVEKAATVRVPLTKRAQDTLYVLAAGAPYTSKEVKLTDKAFIGRTAKQEALIKGAYAAACILTQRVKTDQAIEVLGTLGDKAMIDAVTNAFTAAEYGAAEDGLREAMAGPSKRMTKGRDTNYVPPANAYCLLDLLEDLQQAKMLPFHKDFNYKRVGAKAEVKPGYGKFTPVENASTAMSTFTWNESRLNLSVLANIKGTVDLQERDGKKPSDFGLLANYPTAVWRNYTIVKDGALNVTQLPVTGISKDLATKLAGLNIIGASEVQLDKDGKVSDTVYTLDLTKLPIVNRSIANGKTSAKALCKLINNDFEYKGKLKVFKFYRDALEEAKAKAEGPVGDVATFLEANGIKNGSFSAPTEPLKFEDFYDAKTFDIDVKGFSSLPKVLDVVKKLDEKKALKPVEELVAAGIKAYRAAGVENMQAEVAKAWLDSQVKAIGEAQRANRREIQETKFAIVLGKKWFDEFTSREEGTLDVDGRTFVFKLGTEKVKF